MENEKKTKTKEEKAFSRKLLWDFLKGSKLFFIVSMLSAAVAALADMVSPQIIRMAVDNALGGKESNLSPFVMGIVDRFGGFAYLGEHIWIMAAAILVVAAVKVVAQYCFRVYNTKGAETLTKTMRDRLFGHIERLPYAWHAKHRTGDIIQRCTSDIETMKRFVSEQMTSIFRILVLLVLSLSFMLSMNWKLTVIAMLPVPYVILRSFQFHRKIGAAFLDCDENEGKLSAMAQENLTGVRVVRAFGRERYEKDRFEQQNEHYTNLWMKLASPMARFWSISDVLSGLQIMLIVVFGSWLCIRGEMLPGEYIAFLSYGATMTWPVRMLGRMISEMSKAGVSIDRVAYIMRAEEEKETGKALTPPMDRDIRFDHVSFAYEGSPEILHDISFTMKAGSTLGILGGTGSGKSTMMLFRRQRQHHRGRRGPAGYPDPAPAAEHRHGAAGALSLLPHHRREHQHHPGRNAHGAHPGGLPGRLSGRDGGELPEGLRHLCGRTGRDPLRRPEAAGRHRPHPDPAEPHHDL